MIPQTFEQWKGCITNDCKIILTSDFARTRLLVYQDRKNQETQQFIWFYGEQHLENIIQWFKEIAD
ncbi:MAG TPA: hypothetical protein VG603_00935 [Chitinophagales bacterium]|nr:hypothetical protein [Chitinophagales bacterium]